MPLSLLKEEEEGFGLAADSQGLALVLDRKRFQKAKSGQASGRTLIQLATLRILEEQGIAEEIGDGYHIPSEAAVQLDDEVREQLGLPGPWLGRFRIYVSGSTFLPTFSFYLALLRPDGSDAGRYELNGPLIRLSESENYLPTLPQWRALEIGESHARQSAGAGGHSEVDNLTAVRIVQESARAGADIDLGPFKTLNILQPEKIGVAVIDTEEGGLELIPQFDGATDADMTRKRLGQVSGQEEGSIHLGDQIIILDKQRMRSVREIVENRKIRPEHRKAFLENPAAFIDASLVDLDLGFSIRVRGATRFRLAYFGETEGSEVDWFAASGSETKVFIGAAGARQLIKDKADLPRFQELLESAVTANASEFPWSENIVFQFDDPAPIRAELEAIRDRLEEEGPTGSGDGDAGDDPEEADPELAVPEPGPIVVDIDTNDENGPTSEPAPESWQDVIDHQPIDTGNLNLQPYSYQEQGIRWILGLAAKSLGQASEQESLLGSLLADDMGLGKTFMTLAAIEQYFVRCERVKETPRPVLVVAPLSLLENWRDEVGKVFAVSPFSDIVMLQSDADLSRFRRPGGGRETTQDIDVAEEAGRESLAEIKYSLYVGPDEPTRRLDLPRRLVLTSYQTLRDYQFSLSRVDWSFVVFDEAQNIKNPNALQTRAAKALKAKFRLMVTGTPVENELRDFWCLLDTAKPTLLGPYQKFRQNYVKPIINAEPEARPYVRLEIGQKLRKKVGAYMLRRLKEDHLEGLPTKTITIGVETPTEGELFSQDLVAEMPQEQLERYNAVVSGVRSALEEEDAQGAALKGLHHLRAVSLHPDCIAGGMPRPGGKPREIRAEFARSGKLKKLLELLDTIKDRNEKAIIFCINKRLQIFLQLGLEALFQVPVHVINGDTTAVAKKATDSTRKGLIASFEDRKGFGVIIMSPIAAGVGLTVVGANNVIHLERHWNPAKENQATDRVYRIGQTLPVNIYVPVLHHPTLDSFDVNLSKLLSKKTGLRDAIVTADAVTPEEMMGSGLFGEVAASEGTRILVDRTQSMNWEYFEALVGVLAKKEYSATVHLTDRHDHGCDVVVLPPSGPGRLIQCKHTLGKRLKGYSPITEIVGAKPMYEHLLGRDFSVLEVFTNARTYDREAKASAKASSVKLNDWSDLKQLLSRHVITDADLIAMMNADRLSFRA